MRLLLILLVPVLVFSAWQYTRREANEDRLALAASRVAQRDVDVSCPGFWARLVEITPYAGSVDFDEHGRPGDTTRLAAATCRSLERIWRGDGGSFTCLRDGGCGGDTLQAVHGLVTLAHEAWHLRGVTVEAETQCYALQTVERVARELGVTPAEARLVAAWAAADDAARPADDYHSPECRPGGAYDLEPDTRAWPSG
jgi:hypothetical protein